MVLVSLFNDFIGSLNCKNLRLKLTTQDLFAGSYSISGNYGINWKRENDSNILDMLVYNWSMTTF